MPKQNKNKTKTPYTKTKQLGVHFVLAATTSGLGDDTRVWLIHSVTLHLRKWFSLSQKVSIVNNLIRDGSSCSLLPLNAGTPLILNLGRPCSCYRSLCEFIGTSVLFSGSHPSLLALRAFRNHFPHRSLTLVGRGLRETSDFGLSPVKSLSFSTLSTCESLC